MGALLVVLMGERGCGAKKRLLSLQELVLFPLDTVLCHLACVFICWNTTWMWP